MEWIKCSDTMPPPRKKVLILVGDRGKYGIYDVGFRMIGSNFFLCNTRQYAYCDVGYWCELPELPEEEVIK